MRHNALSAIAAATRCGGSGVSCRLQPGRAVAVDSCSLQLDTDKNSDIPCTRSEINDYDTFRVITYRTLWDHVQNLMIH